MLSFNLMKWSISLSGGKEFSNGYLIILFEEGLTEQREGVLKYPKIVFGLRKCICSETVVWISYFVNDCFL